MGRVAAHPVLWVSTVKRGAVPDRLGFKAPDSKGLIGMMISLQLDSSGFASVSRT